MLYKITVNCANCKDKTQIFRWSKLTKENLINKYRALKELIANKNRCPKNPAHSLCEFKITDESGNPVKIADLISTSTNEDTITT